MNTLPDWLIIPVKSFSTAKRRLSSTLTLVQRSQLAQAMLEDILAAATKVSELRNIALLGGAQDVAAFATAKGLAVIDDQAATDTNAAVIAGLAYLSNRRAGTVVVLAGDVPAVTAADIKLLFQEARAHEIVIAPALADGGTNALGLASPDRMTTHFGPESFARHMKAAAEAGLRPSIIENARLGSDLDGPDDLNFFLRYATHTQTFRLLSSLNSLALGSPESSLDHAS